MSLARNTFVQASLTLASRILGFARDLVANAQFGGQGPLMDAFATALMFPNLFRRLFAEGAFAQAFVPVYARERAENGEESADRIASESLSFLLLVVAVFCIAAQIAMPWLMPWLLSAYVDDPEVMRIATLMTQLTMPYLACMTIASLISGVLNTAGRFALSAGVPTLLNLCTIAGLLLAPDAQAAAIWVSVAVTVAGVLQAGLLWWGAGRIGAKLRLGWPQFTPAVRKLLFLAIPGALAGGAMQINTLVSQFLTGSDEGARATLYNSDRLYQLPLGLIGVAVGLALVPRLARHHAAGETEQAQGAMDDAIGISMALTVPAAIAFLIMPFFIIDATVTRGAFTSEDAQRTAEVLRQFAWGVPAFVLAKVFTPPFFARQDTRRPMQFAMTSVAVNTLVGAGLFFALPSIGVDGVIGLGVATSFSGWLNVFLLSSTLAREGTYRISGRAWGRLLRLGVACLIMGVFVGVCAAHYEYLSRLLWKKEVAVLAVAFAAFVLYCIAALALRAVSLREIRGALRREAGPPGGGGGLPGGVDG
ncbi:murein biosynthesis integral membrane protein MurJ [Terricaulis sp.]|uniref:murein biosynthesis integral membrane protein MurJ n=1 Tax=Terricaulis sp. TaxID=2768686 RepID=UPI003784D530